jgi:hypothetical protein
VAICLILGLTFYHLVCPCLPECEEGGEPSGALTGNARRPVR